MTHLRATNELACSIVPRVTGQAPKEPEKTPEQLAAALLGRRGGLKGGPARAAKLSRKRRVEIARAANAARWRKRAT